MAHVADTGSNPSWVLADAHVFQLSQELTSVRDLHKLAHTGLKLKSSDVESAITNAPNDIQTAAYRVLQAWMKQQERKEETYPKLVEALNECNMKMLASNLKEWIQLSNSNALAGKERKKYIQTWTKNSFKSKPFCLVVGKDWTVRPDASKIDLRMMYTRPKYLTKVRKPNGVSLEHLEDIPKLLQHNQSDDDCPIRIFVQAHGGMGKTTATKHLAITWAEGTSDEMKKFDFVFHISLKHVKDNCQIENIIITQHQALESHNVQPTEIRTILEKSSNEKVLLILDGHDEYTTGLNTDIDKLIENKRFGNCSLILTSRHDQESSSVRNMMTHEIEILEFDLNGVKEYATKWFDNEKTADALMKEASGPLSTSDGAGGQIADLSLFGIPILLNMICVLFQCDHFSLPRTRTRLIEAMVDRCINREAIRSQGRKAVENAKIALLKLGNLAWKGILTRRFIFDKAEVVRVAGQEALELGLLMGTETSALREEHTDVVCFIHILFQEYVAAFFLSILRKVRLRKIFSSWSSIYHFSDVFRLVCGLKTQSAFLVELINERLLPSLRESFLCQNQIDVLKTFQSELSDKYQIEVLHNKYMNYIDKNEMYVLVPSKFYVFSHDICKMPKIREVRSQSKSCQEAECSILVRDENALVIILKTIQQIAKHQQVFVTSFQMIDTGSPSDMNSHEYNPRDRTLLNEFLKFNKSMTNCVLRNCSLTNLLSKHIAKQLHGCTKVSHLCMLNVQGEIQLNLGKSLETMASLTHAHFGTPMTPDVSCKVMEGLSQCILLTDLMLASCKITDNLHVLFNVKREWGFVHLETLTLANVGLSSNDVKALSHAIAKSIIPCLRHLNLACNKLTDYIQDLFGKPVHTTFSTLEELNLQSTQLSKISLRHLAIVLSNKRMSKCTTLFLSGNIFTGILDELLASRCLPNVEYLDLIDCKLNVLDIKCIQEAIARGLLPSIDGINFDVNQTLFCESCANTLGELSLEDPPELDTKPDVQPDPIASLCNGAPLVVQRAFQSFCFKTQKGLLPLPMKETN